MTKSKGSTSVVNSSNKKTVLQEFRSKLSHESCVICWEENPNIATLCCASPVHLKCLNEWTRRNPSCMVCRSNLLPPSSIVSESSSDEEFSFIIRPFGFAMDSSSSSSSSSDSSDSFTSSSEEESTIYLNDDFTDEFTYNSSTDSDMPGLVNRESRTSSDDEEASTNIPDYEELHDSSVESNQSFFEPESPLSETDTFSMEQSVEMPPLLPRHTPNQYRYRGRRFIFCVNECRRPAAYTCANGKCRSCCIREGPVFCARHNNRRNLLT